jgi:hypothetical protein
MALFGYNCTCLYRTFAETEVTATMHFTGLAFAIAMHLLLSRDPDRGLHQREMTMTFASYLAIFLCTLFLMLTVLLYQPQTEFI